MLTCSQSISCKPLWVLSARKEESYPGSLSLSLSPNDKEVMVKISFAECVADLAKTAHRSEATLKLVYRSTCTEMLQCPFTYVIILCRFLELAQLQANQDADESSFIMQYQVSTDPTSPATTCLLHVLLHVHYMSTTCPLHVYYMSTTCLLHVNYMSTTCPLHVPIVCTSQVQGSYDSELTQLQQSFQSKIVHLLTDSVRHSFPNPSFLYTCTVTFLLCKDSLVKKTFLRHSAGKLCTFFGPLRGVVVVTYTLCEAGLAPSNETSLFI